MPPSELPAVVCAWCGRTLQAGSAPISHGICNECQDRIGKAEGQRARPQPATPNFTEK